MSLKLKSSHFSRQSLAYSGFGPPCSALELVASELPPLPRGHVRIAMSLAPVNPSDLIPITGAYAQRIGLPAVAGYEGVGVVLEASPEFTHLIGKRVLPLRGEGTWQTIVDCPGIHAVAVPDAISDLIAARAYINPLAALTMLRLWPVRGKTVLLSGAGSSCADLLGHWALQMGARKVIGLYRSESRAPRMRSIGIEPISLDDWEEISGIARHADVTFDALGGPVASRILHVMQSGSTFVSYGLLTGRSITTNKKPNATHSRFHLRDHIAEAAPRGMSNAFTKIWPLLAELDWPDTSVFPLMKWRDAVLEADTPGSRKPLIDFRK